LIWIRGVYRIDGPKRQQLRERHPVPAQPHVEKLNGVILVVESGDNASMGYGCTVGDPRGVAAAP